MPSNTTAEPNKAIEHYKIKFAAVAEPSNEASLNHEGKQMKMEETDRVKKKKIKALMFEDEAGEQASKAKDVGNEAKCSATKPFSDMKEVEATASMPKHKGSPHLETSPLPSIIEACGAPAATAHDRQLRNKEADRLKSKVQSVKDENKSSQAGVGEGKKETIKGDGDPPVKKL